MTNFSEIYDIAKFKTLDYNAPGHYARVFEFYDLRQGRPVAFKLLRPEHLVRKELKWEFRAFGLEARLLRRLHEQPWIVQLYDCGFISNKQDERPREAEIISFGTDIDAFVSQMTEYHKRQWRPYLSEEVLPENHNLLFLLRGDGTNQRRRFPSEEALSLALQYAHMLQHIHNLDIAYLDVKLEHLYWNGRDLRLIDWNSSRDLLDPATQANLDPDHARKEDIRYFVVGILYPILTGHSASGIMFTPTPSNLDTVATRYQNIQHLDFGMREASSLLPSLIEIMQAGAERKYTNAAHFIADLATCAREHGWLMEGMPPPTLKASQAREILCAGLEALRRAQLEAEQARLAFKSALRKDVNNQEARRLMELTEIFLNHRVIP